LDGDRRLCGWTTAGGARRVDAANGFLITSKWLTAEARELGFSAPERAASKQLELLIYDQRTHTPYYGVLPRDPELRRLLLSGKAGWSDRLWLMRLGVLATDLERDRVSQARREISQAQVTRYYEAHGQQFFVPKRSDLEILGSYKRPVVVKARREVEARTPFVTVARRVTITRRLPTACSILSKGGRSRPLKSGLRRCAACAGRPREVWLLLPLQGRQGDPSASKAAGAGRSGDQAETGFQASVDGAPCGI
jgi:hypothetical protein